ncbi:MAG TPA: hypothetical protein VEK08_12380 [Planctomycetota bacterium]|nr:hypothetical protein [Planctomycetota bacterium]
MLTTFVRCNAALALFVSFQFACAIAGEAPPPPANAPANAAAPAPEPPAEWQKIETKNVLLPQPRQILSPGLFDAELQRIIDFPKDGAAVDLGLPQEGKDAAGKPFVPLMARLAQGFIWVDLNGDGKSSNDETRRISPDGYTDPVSCELHYADGSKSEYSFRFKSLVDNEQYALLRSCAKTFELDGKKVVLLDENGNGKYNDTDKDGILIGEGPVSFCGKYIAVGTRFYELIVHEAGTVVEVRPAPKTMATGTVDLFEKFKIPQKSENLKIHMLIVAGPEGSFSVDDKRRTVKVPAGAYDLVFGLFERAKEVVYLKKGEKTSFNVIAEKTATMAWGGEVKAKFDIQSDVQPEPRPGTKVDDKNKTEEKNIWVGVPSFFGEGSEQYIPENFRTIPVNVNLARVFTDRMKLDRKEPAGSRRYDVLPNGQLKPVTFKPSGTTSGEYEVAVTYASGIMGSVTSRQRYNYVYRRKPAPEKTK